MANTIKRIGYWAIGALLPNQEVFNNHIRNMARGVMFLVCGGMIIAALFLATLAGVYALLLEQGLSVLTSAVLTAVIALMGAALCFLMAERSLNRASRLTEELKITPPSLPTVKADIDMQEGVSVLFNAFIDGFRGRGEVYRAQADLFDYEDEDIADVHIRHKSRHEHYYDDDKDIIRFRPRHERRNDVG
ncbi:MAG: phage holin family protein [Alphaproteobacteria bacterium]|nr:phage holin family protein [Alphaproteobacteria bacterium]